MSLVLVVIAIVCSLIIFHSTPTQSQCTTGVYDGPCISGVCPGSAICVANSCCNITTPTPDYYDDCSDIGTGCPLLAYLCTNTLYYALLQQQCPYTCGRCNTTSLVTINRCSSGTDQGQLSCTAPNVCSTGFSCVYSSIATTYICCSSTTNSTTNTNTSSVSSTSTNGTCTGSFLTFSGTTPVQCFKNSDCITSGYPYCLTGNGLTYKVCCSTSG